MGIRTILGQKKPRSQTRSARLDAEPIHIERQEEGLSLWSRIPGILLAVGALVLFIMFMTDSRFRVEAVTIEGTENLSVSQIEEALAFGGRSIFAIGETQAEQLLEETFPTLANVSIECTLPNQVVVIIQESDVVMVWESGGRYWWVGSEGKVYGETEGGDGLVVVHDLGSIASEPVGYLPLVPVDLVQDLSACMSEQQTFDYTPDSGLLIYASSGSVPVMLGDDGDACQKIAVLQSLLSYLGSDTANIEYIDLRNEDRPLYHLAE